MFAVEAFPATELGNASFLVADAEHGVGLVVDPYRDVDGYLTRASSLGIKLTHALDTHLHNDFASGRGELAAEAGRGSPDRSWRSVGSRFEHSARQATRPTTRATCCSKAGGRARCSQAGR